MVEISCKEFFFSPRLRVIYRVFHLYKFPGVQELIIDRVFSFREFISSFIRFSFLEGGGLQTQEGSPLNAFATFKANTQIFTCMASLIRNKVTVMLRGFFHNCWGFFPVGLSDVQWGVHTVWSTVSQGVKKISSSVLNSLGMRRGKHC